MTAWFLCVCFVQSMEKSFEDLLTGLDDEFEPDIDDIFTNCDHLPEVCHLVICRGQPLAAGNSYLGTDLLDFNLCGVNFMAISLHLQSLNSYKKGDV